MGWYLERREGEVASLTEAEKNAIEAKLGGSLSDRVIPLKEGAQAYVATYMRQPEWAKKNPKLIFLGAVDGGYFDRVFNTELTAEKFASAFRLSRCTDSFVRQFMTRKRRADKVEDWRKDYAELLGRPVVDKHGSVLNQVVPQSATFLTALLFDREVVLKGSKIEDVIKVVQSSHEPYCDLLLHIIDTAAFDDRASKSWPTLLKSQAFFEKVSTYLRGIASAH
jgi:hypothetical protein